MPRLMARNKITIDNKNASIIPAEQVISFDNSSTAARYTASRIRITFQLKVRMRYKSKAYRTGKNIHSR